MSLFCHFLQYIAKTRFIQIASVHGTHLISTFLFFSAKKTVQWYFIVGPLLAVVVLAFIVFCLWKKGIACTYTTSDKGICILDTNSYKHQTYIIYILIVRNHTALFCSQYSSDHFLLTVNFIFSSFFIHEDYHNKIKSRQINCGCAMKI